MVLDEDEIQVDSYNSSAECLEDYTTIWLEKTDRGGLVHVIDLAFWLFCKAEVLTN